MQINENFKNLNESYLFSAIAKKVADFQEACPDKKIIRLGIGDVTQPLCPAVVSAMEKAVAEMGAAATFRGYGPEQGYLFLREAIARYYAGHGVTVAPDEIYVGDGAKSDIGNILDLFGPDNVVLMPDPVYPVYADTNIMAGRRVLYARACEENGFLPPPEKGTEADIIYICSPNNPTGAVYDKAGLRAWVDYANSRGALIIFDAAYESFISDSSLPRSIFEIPGARDCAIEFCSMSKKAGFTGTRCGYTVIPRELSRCGVSLGKMWVRRQTTKFNGVAYVVQRGAEAVFTEEGERQTTAAIDVYRGNAVVLMKALTELGVWFTGGKNSPYVWMKCPDGMDSWGFFDRLLSEAAVVGTPGVGFGQNGEGFFRLTAFGSPAATAEAMERLRILLK